jgi:hypothetical protein
MRAEMAELRTDVDIRLAGLRTEIREANLTILK